MALSTESYKGVRDFYPEDKFIQNYIFKKMREVVERYGYNEYDASVLEPAELYKAKSGSELVNEQTYTFIDRGEREVTLRPEMTPTVARMVAARQKELVFPLRWYSIPNLFRYEKPQRGRLREHWQLNVDMFGVESLDADIEVISIAYDILKNFGAQESDFVIKINSRKIMADLYAKNNLSEEDSYKVSKIIDKKDKISEDEYKNLLTDILGEHAVNFMFVLSSSERLLDYLGEENESAKEIVQAISKLIDLGITNVVFDPNLMRGLDYYTGIVFEVFDTNKDNPRSMFGGGRYNDLLDIFGAQKIPAFGFGMGDVGAQNFLEVHGLLPVYTPETQISLCTLKEEFIPHAEKLARTLRASGVKVSIDLTRKKVGDQIKTADKNHIPYVLVIGEDEIKSGIYSFKHLHSGEEKKLTAEQIIEALT